MSGAKVENPVRRVRQELGLTQAELALLCQVNNRIVSAIERGMLPELPRAVRDALRELGYKVEDLDRQYAQFKEALRNEILARVRSKRRQ